MAPPALRIPVRADLGPLEQDMEKGLSITKQATTKMLREFVMIGLESSKQLAGQVATKQVTGQVLQEVVTLGAKGATSVAGVGAEVVKLGSPLTALRLGVQGTSLALQALNVAGKEAWSQGLFGQLFRAVAPWTAVIGGAMLAKAAITSLIDVTREGIKDILELFDKAQKAGVDPQYFQAFVALARNGKVEAKELEAALNHAYNAAKPMLNPDWKVWDEGLAKVNAIEKSLVDARELFTTDQKFTGVDLFRNATDQENRNRAVLIFMEELRAIGEDLVALDIAEKMFGAKFADDIRNGNTTARELLDTIDKLRNGGPGVWSEKLVEETKEVDRLLKSASEHLSTAITPQYEGLVSLGNELKTIWAGLIDILARGALILNELDPIKWADRLRAWSRGETQEAFEKRMREFRDSQDLAAQAGLGDIGKGAAPSQLADDAGGRDVGPPRNRAGEIPLPRRRPSDAPKKKEEDDDEKDAFDRATAAINRQIAALHADAAAVGLSHSAHAQLRVELHLLEAARQSGVEITDEQIAAYAKLRNEMSAEQALAASGIKLEAEQAEAFGKLSQNIRMVAESLERKKTAFAATNDFVRFAGHELINVIDRATEKGAKFGDIMADVFRSVAKEALKAAITGEGAFAKMFGLNSNTGGVGGLGGLIAGLFGGGMGGANPAVAGATNIVGIAGNVPIPTFMAGGGRLEPGGMAYVGEHGLDPKLIRNDTGRNLMVTPNDIATNGGAGDSITVALHVGGIDARGAAPGVGEEIASTLEARIIPKAVAAFREALIARRI